MKLFAHKDAPKAYARERVFRYSPVTGFVAVFVSFFLFFGCLILALSGGYKNGGFHLDPVLLYWFAFVAFVFSLICLYYFRARTRPTNWLVKAYPDRMLVKFRSYLNDHYPDTDLAIVEIPYSEIAWARKTREKLTTPSCGTDERQRVQFYTFLDFKLKGVDAAPLSEALETERKRWPYQSEVGKWKRELFDARKRKAPEHEIARIRQSLERAKERQPKRKRGDGVKHHDYPVRVVDTDTVRIQWNGIRPKIKPALDFFSTHFPVEPELSLDTDATEANGKPADDRILDLALRGDTITATALTKKTYGYSLKRSKEFVDELLQR